MCGIGFLGFCVWGHHMFISGMSPYSAFAFSIMTMTIGVPSAIKTFNWLGTLWGGKIQFTTAMMFALGFVSVFVTGGLSGLFLAQPSVDLPLHDTYFVVAHFHLIMGVAAIFGIFAATYFWFPKMFGKFMNETVGKIHFWLTFAGVYCIFMPMHFLGIAGHMRRYSDLSGVPFLTAGPHSLLNVQYFISIAAFITIGAQLLFLGNLISGLWGGKKAEMNPWNATTLEWTIPSPPPYDNFAGQIPTVYRGAYEFSVPGEAQDFILQSALPSEVERSHR
jgi:cytochrome c oxidase subunit 1